jgi:hypothetical protein
MTAPSLRDRITESVKSADDGLLTNRQVRAVADAVLAVLADADPTDLGLEQVGWLGLLTDDPSWVPLPAMPSEFHTDLPVYARPRTEETPDA